MFEAFEHFVCSEKTQISNDRFGFKLLLIVFSSSGIIPFGAANACYEDQAEEFVDSEKVLIAFLRFFLRLKLRNNADVAKRFWKINAVRPINKGISRKIEESPQGATTQIEADCGTN